MQSLGVPKFPMEEAFNREHMHTSTNENNTSTPSQVEKKINMTSTTYLSQILT